MWKRPIAMGAFPFKIYCQKHIISTEFYVEFMCFWDNVFLPQIEIDVITAVLGLKSGRIRAKSVELCMDMTENLKKRSEKPGRRR